MFKLIFYGSGLLLAFALGHWCHPYLSQSSAKDQNQPKPEPSEPLVVIYEEVAWKPWLEFFDNLWKTQQEGAPNSGQRLAKIQPKTANDADSSSGVENKPTVFTQLVQSLPDDELLKMIEDRTTLTKIQFDPNLSLSDIAQLLWDLERGDSTHLAHDVIRFGLGIAEDQSLLSPSDSFANEQQTIYGIMSVAPGTPKSLLVKWHKDDESMPFAYFSMDLSAHSKGAYFTHQPDEAWQEGTYRVEVFNASDGFKPVGAGRFHILNALLAAGDSES